MISSVTGPHRHNGRTHSTERRFRSLNGLEEHEMDLRRISTNKRSHLRPLAIGALVAVALLALTGPTPLLAQDMPRVKAGVGILESSGCPHCHWAFADGGKQSQEAPTRAELRTGRIDWA